MSADSFSLYVHIPYCLHKCPYCDFNTFAVNSIPEQEYTRALLSEFDALSASDHWEGKKIRTVYFGGGTPSLFSNSSINTLLNAFFAHNDSLPIEITIEANPGALTYEKLSQFFDAGISRLSLGAQSFSQQSLLNLGRIHKPEDIELSVNHARQCGYKNINLDLMYGIPHQTFDDLKSDLQCYLDLSPEHISAYGLSIEKGTPFYQRFKKGDLNLPEEDELIHMIALVNESLFKQLYYRYEISNYCKSGFEAVHNVAYWEGREYIGLGAGAHSLQKLQNSDASPIVAMRYANIADPKLYMEKAMSTGSAIAWQDELSTDDAIFETFFLGLRTDKGVQVRPFEERFGFVPQRTYGSLIAQLEQDDLIQASDECIKLTEKGFLLSDSVIAMFAEPDTEPSRIKAPRQSIRDL